MNAKIYGDFVSDAHFGSDSVTGKRGSPTEFRREQPDATRERNDDRQAYKVRRSRPSVRSRSGAGLQSQEQQVLLPGRRHISLSAR
jgi:hypothetical protein